MIDYKEIQDILIKIAEKRPEDQRVPNYKAFIGTFVSSLQKLQNKLGEKNSHEFLAFFDALVPNIYAFLVSKPDSQDKTANDFLHYIDYFALEFFDVDILSEEEDEDIKNYVSSKVNIEKNQKAQEDALQDIHAFSIAQILHDIRVNIVEGYLRSLKTRVKAPTSVRYDAGYLYNFSITDTINTKVFKENPPKTLKQKEAINAISVIVKNMKNSVSTLWKDIRAQNKDVYIGSPIPPSLLSKQLKSLVKPSVENSAVFNDLFTNFSGLIAHYDYLYRSWFLLHCYNRVYNHFINVRGLIVRDISSGDRSSGSGLVAAIKNLNNFIDGFRKELLSAYQEMSESHKEAFQYIKSLRSVEPNIFKDPETAYTFKEIGFEDVYYIGKKILAAFPNDNSFIDKSSSGFNLIALDTKNLSAEKSHNNQLEFVGSQIRQDFLYRMLVRTTIRQQDSEDEDPYLPKHIDDRSDIVDAIISGMVRSIALNLNEKKYSAIKARDYLGGALRTMRPRHEDAATSYNKFVNTFKKNDDLLSSLTKMPDLPKKNDILALKARDEQSAEIAEKNAEIIKEVARIPSSALINFINMSDILAKNWSKIFSKNFSGKIMSKISKYKTDEEGKKVALDDLSEFYADIRMQHGKIGAEFFDFSSEMLKVVESLQPLRTAALQLNIAAIHTRTHRKSPEYFIAKYNSFKSMLEPTTEETNAEQYIQALKKAKDIFVGTNGQDSLLIKNIEKLLQKIQISSTSYALTDPIWGRQFSFELESFIDNIIEEFPEIPDNNNFVEDFMKNPDVVDIFQNTQESDNIEEQMLRLRLVAKSVVASLLIETRTSPTKKKEDKGKVTVKIDPLEIWNRIQHGRELSFYGMVSEICKIYNLDAQDIFKNSTLEQDSFYYSSGLYEASAEYFDTFNLSFKKVQELKFDVLEEILNVFAELPKEPEVKKRGRPKKGDVKNFKSKYTDEDITLARKKAENVLLDIYQERKNMTDVDIEQYDTSMALKNVDLSSHKTTIVESEGTVKIGGKETYLNRHLRLLSKEILDCLPEILARQQTVLKNARDYYAKQQKKNQGGESLEEKEEGKE